MSEEVVAIGNLAKEITISYDLDNFVPFVSNGAETASKKSSQSQEADASHFCNFRVKGIKRNVKKNNENKGREFWGCGKHFNNPKKCN